MRNPLRGTQAPSTQSAAAASTSTHGKEKDELVLVEKTGKTKGKGSKEITYSELSRVPVSIDEFNAVTGTSSMPELCEYLYTGYNTSQYEQAADEIGEFVDDNWNWLTKEQFRNATRSMFKLFAGQKTIEEVAQMMIPGAIASNEGNILRAKELEAERAKKAEKKKGEGKPSVN